MPRSPSRLEVTASIALSIGLGALNSVLSKIKADQLQIFDGLVSGIMNAIGYMVGYFPILYWRYRSGLVTREMLRFMYVDAGEPRPLRGAHRFIVLGGLADEAGQVLGSIASPYVSIVASALLGQTSSIWTTMTSAVVLKARYTTQEFVGIAVALAGASIEVWSLRQGDDKSTRFDMATLVLLAAMAPAISFVFKEHCFRLWHKRRDQALLTRADEGSAAELDVWVVASAAALWSWIWAPATSLVISLLKKPSGMSVSHYAATSFGCFLNRVDYDDRFMDDDEDDASDAHLACRWAWQFWLVYMIVNVAYNISIYRVIRITSTLTSFVAGKLVTPATLALSLAPWPVIGRGSVNPMQGLSLLVIFLGVAIFRQGTVIKERVFPDGAAGACCWPLAAECENGAPRDPGVGFQRLESTHEDGNEGSD